MKQHLPVTIDPDAPAIARFINRAVDRRLEESPVRYAFDNGFPAHLTQLEGREVLQAVRNCQPQFTNIHGGEHKDLAVKEVMDSIKETKEKRTANNRP